MRAVIAEANQAQNDANLQRTLENRADQIAQGMIPPVHFVTATENPMAEGEEYYGSQGDEGWEVPRDTGAGAGLFH